MLLNKKDRETYDFPDGFYNFDIDKPDEEYYYTNETLFGPIICKDYADNIVDEILRICKVLTYKSNIKLKKTYKKDFQKGGTFQAFDVMSYIEKNKLLKME